MKLRSTWACVVVVLFALPRAGLADGNAGGTAQSEKARPKQLKDDWKGIGRIASSSLRVWSGNEESGFGLQMHRKLAERGSVCSEQLVGAQYRQDIRMQFEATAHFDNCAFDGTFQALQREIDEVDKLLTAPKDKKAAALEAMSRLGRMLHAIQDFYAHTNWVELQHKAEVPFDSALVVPVWTEEGRKRVRDAKELISGYVWWSMTPNRCPSTDVTHEKLAKDASTTPTGKLALARWERTAFSAALTLAQWATSVFLQWAYQKWPTLAEQCGPELYVIVTRDRRPQ